MCFVVILQQRLLLFKKPWKWNKFKREIKSMFYVCYLKWKFSALFVKSKFNLKRNKTKYFDIFAVKRTHFYFFAKEKWRLAADWLSYESTLWTASGLLWFWRRQTERQEDIELLTLWYLLLFEQNYLAIHFLCVVVD